ncbi:hypothetical protein TcBrA4_0051550 [Trypanosoma cruzi]|nr:hypothetical protein TcBrA4_0051550 [Trypanosoma cruzi]
MRHGPSRVKLLALADPWGVNAADPRRIELAPVHHRLALKIFYAVNPLSLLRAAGPVGPKLFKSLRPDFANRWRSFLASPQVFYEYTYHCNAQLPPLGEMLFKACCHAGCCCQNASCGGAARGFVEGDPAGVVVRQPYVDER